MVQFPVCDQGAEEDSDLHCQVWLVLPPQNSSSEDKNSKFNTACQKEKNLNFTSYQHEIIHSCTSIVYIWTLAHSTAKGTHQNFLILFKHIYPICIQITYSWSYKYKMCDHSKWLCLALINKIFNCGNHFFNGNQIILQWINFWKTTDDFTIISIINEQGCSFYSS